MTKNQLKKISNLKSLKCKQFREINYAKNSIILRKNQSTKYVYLLKLGEAAIFADSVSEKPLHIYKEGNYLNSVEVCMSMNSCKTVKAITKCEVLLLAWTKERQDEEKKVIFIPKIQEMKFYQVSLFKSLTYGLMVELLLHFSKEVISKYQVNQFLKNKKFSTCFIITGVLTIQGFSKTKQVNNLKRSASCHSRHAGKSMVLQKSLKLLKFQHGQMLYLDQQNRFKYTCETQKCEIISINSELLSYFLTTECNQKIKQLKQTQKANIIHLQKNTQKAFNLINKSIDRYASKSQFVPMKFLNQIQRKCENFQKAKSIVYKMSNRNFRSFSEEKKKILDLRDKGYKELSELNRRKYGRDYINEKRIEISKNINGDLSPSTSQNLQKSQSQNIPKQRATVYESVNLKEDFAILKKSSLFKFIRRNKINSKIQFKSHNVSPIKLKVNQTQIQNLTLKSVSKIRKNFEDDSKTLLKNHKRKQMVMEF